MSALLQIGWWKWLQFVATIRCVNWTSEFCLLIHWVLAVLSNPILSSAGTELLPSSFFVTENWQRAYVLCSGLIPKGKRSSCACSVPPSKLTNHTIHFFPWGGVREGAKRGWKCLISVHPCSNRNPCKRRSFLQHCGSFFYRSLLFVPLSLFK